MKPESSQKDELKTFLLITVVLAPVLTLLFVSGFGFSVWISQLLLGPPGS